MRTPRLGGTGLAVATVALAVAGCTNDGTATPSPGASATSTVSTAPSASGSADPSAVSALADATAKLGTTSVRVTVTSGVGFKLTGVADPARGLGTAELTAKGENTELTANTRVFDKDLYVQVPGFTKGDSWMHIDMSRLPEGANLGIRPGQIDPANTAQLLGSTTDVRSTGDREYAGTLDLTKAAGLGGLDKVTIDGYGAAGQRVPFTAKLDEQNRLTALTVQVPAVNGQRIEPIEVRYTDYGMSFDAARPDASKITEAPANFYQSLGR